MFKKNTSYIEKLNWYLYFELVGTLQEFDFILMDGIEISCYSIQGTTNVIFLLKLN